MSQGVIIQIRIAINDNIITAAIANLQSGVFAMVNDAVLDDVMTAGYYYAVVTGVADFQAFQVPVRTR
jgi:hypothetical protein